MNVKDYNGSGRWSIEAVCERYAQYARRFHVAPPRDLSPCEHTEREMKWVYPIMQRVIEGIEAGDMACIQLGVEFIQEDAKFPFGKVLKSNTARALRRASLTPEQAVRIRRRVLGMLLAGHVPHEFREYAKLLRKIGVGDEWPMIRKQLDPSNPYVMRFCKYFEDTC
jgi:hypothetical protein